MLTTTEEVTVFMEGNASTEVEAYLIPQVWKNQAEMKVCPTARKIPGVVN